MDADLKKCHWCETKTRTEGDCGPCPICGSGMPWDNEKATAIYRTFAKTFPDTYPDAKVFKELLNRAATRIERTTRYLTYWESRCRTCEETISKQAARIAELEAALEQSRRRERAAVADMEHIANAINNCHKKVDGDDEVRDFGLGRCDVCTKECEGECRFKWRGPSEAVEKTE